MANYPRGSEWRRWDLHVHTPYSVLSNNFGTDFDTYARELLIRAAARDICAVGITDYFSVEGYDHLLGLIRDEAWLGTLDDVVAAHARTLLVLANVELRGFIITDDEKRDSRVNYHVIFSDQLSAAEIRDHFLSRLDFTASAAPARPDERMGLTRQNLEDLGRRLKEQHAPFRDLSDLEVGMRTAVVDHEDATESLLSPRFEGKYLLVAPVDEDLATLRWDGQGHLARKVFIQKSHMFFSGNPSTRAFALGQRHPTVQAYLDEFVSLKPTIHGSDAHDYERLFEPDDRKYCWLKADPTWRGLAMLLNEPAERVYIGPRPPQLDAMASRAAKTIRSVVIKKSADATTHETWFDNEVPLNANTCAIIGNRGNGKSAFAEIVGLVGNTKRVQSFSFLTSDRFRSPRVGKASQFEATLQWSDGSSIGPRRLSENPASTSVERVQYIGQGFLEEICNEMDRGQDSRFYHELQDVIFSHVPPGGRQEHSTLRSLLTDLGEGIAQAVGVLQEDVRALNRRILDIGLRLEARHRAELEARLDEVTRQLAAHDAGRPAEVAAPTEGETQEQIDLRQRLEALRAEIVRIDELLLALQHEDAGLMARRGAALRLLERLRAAETVIRGLGDEAAADARTIGVDLSAVLEVTVNTGPITEVLAQTEARRIEIRQQLDPGNAGLARDRADAGRARAEIEERLSTPERQRQEYLGALANWEAVRIGLIGDATNPNSIEGLRAQLAGLTELPAQLADLDRRRQQKLLEIYAAKDRLKQQYEELHRPVSDFLASSDVAASEAFKLRFTAEIVESGFGDTLLAMIDQRRGGTFVGVDEGRAKIDSLLREVDWTSAAQAVAFPSMIVGLLTGGEGSPTRVAEQLKQGFATEDLLDFLFNLDYLSPTYRLTWDDRAVSELSPGERGNLLLIFYLLVDRRDIPLVIDQPEENLDNQTVYKTLVPCMRDARSRRQVLVVTHNPNLAVVCDAEQIIYAAMLKDGSNAISYETGSIENIDINKHLVDVLEGTKPAFSARAAKYLA